MHRLPSGASLVYLSEWPLGSTKRTFMTDDLERSAGVAAGEILAEKYRVERILGVGGMGVVVAARHIELDERVAIKFLLPGMLLDGTSVARFQREARAAVRIKSEHVARVFDVGRLPNGSPYMVMEFLEGLDLAARLQREGPLPVWLAADFVVQACVAVADAHSLGIIHRDLKPANLFCVRRSDGQPSIKVLDFGISKVTDPGAGMSFTQTSAAMGSPLYMSPEQFRSSKNVDARTDIWALGAILFELVTGATPFTATTVTELAIKIATERAPSAVTLRRDVPPALAAVIAKCLEREPEERYRDVGELAHALAPFTSPAARPLVERVLGIVGTPAQAVSSPMPVSRASEVPSPTAPALHYTAPGAPRRRNFGLTVGLVAGVALLALGVGWWRSHAHESDAKNSLSTATGEPALGVTQASGSDRAPPPPVASPPEPVTAPASTVPPPPEVQVVGAASGAASPAVTPTQPTKADRLKLAPRRGKQGTSVAPAPTSAPATPAPAPPPREPAAAPRVSCDPPFFFDSHGNRVFKQECL